MLPRDEIKVEFSLNDLNVVMEIMRMVLDDNSSAAAIGEEDCDVGERIVARLYKARSDLGAALQAASGKRASR